MKNCKHNKANSNKLKKSIKNKHVRINNIKHNDKDKAKTSVKAKTTTTKPIVLFIRFLIIITLLLCIFNVNNIISYFTDVKAITNEFSIKVSYTVEFNANTGEGEMEPQELPYNESMQLSKNQFTKKGYSFKEWNTKANGDGQGYEDLASVTDLGNITLYAQWEMDTYKIEYDLGGGTFDGEDPDYNPNPDTYTVKSLSIILKNPTKKGYTFAGWNITYEDGNQYPYTSIKNGSTGNLKCTAQWTAHKYKIYFYQNRYSSDTNRFDEYQEVEYDVETQLRANPFVREGYEFTGWNTDRNGNGTGFSDCGNVLNLTEVNNGSVNLYAQWKVSGEFNIEYNLDGGHDNPDDPNPATYTVETPSFYLKDPIKTGYTFKGWTGTDLGEDPVKGVYISKGSTGDKKYTAHWTPHVCSIRFYRNWSNSDGTSNDEYQKINYDEQTKLWANTFERPGYRFVKWNTKRDGTGDSYLDCADVLNLSEDNKTINLYAQWERAPETIKYAVQIYGIQQDEGSNGNKLGLTFGPATGANYNDAYVTHRYELNSDGTYNVVIVTHTIGEDGVESTSETDLIDSSGANVTRTEDDMNKYNVNIHDMKWSDIATKSREDPTVFTDCMLCGDTKSVQLTLNTTIGAPKKYVQHGDGASTLNSSLEGTYRRWNLGGKNGMGNGEYFSSQIRAVLIGKNDDTKEDYIGDANLDPTLCLYSCIEKDLQDVIIAKNVKCAAGKNNSGSLGERKDVDKIWLFSGKEFGGTGKYSGNEIEGIGEENIGYRKFIEDNSNYYVEPYNDDDSEKRQCYDENGKKTNYFLRSINNNSTSQVIEVTDARKNTGCLSI